MAATLIALVTLVHLAAASSPPLAPGVHISLDDVALFDNRLNLLVSTRRVEFGDEVLILHDNRKYLVIYDVGPAQPGLGAQGVVFGPLQEFGPLKLRAGPPDEHDPVLQQARRTTIVLAQGKAVRFFQPASGAIRRSILQISDSLAIWNDAGEAQVVPVWQHPSFTEAESLGRKWLLRQTPQGVDLVDVVHGKRGEQPWIQSVYAKLRETDDVSWSAKFTDELDVLAAKRYGGSDPDPDDRLDREAYVFFYRRPELEPKLLRVGESAEGTWARYLGLVKGKDGPLLLLQHKPGVSLRSPEGATIHATNECGVYSPDNWAADPVGSRIAFYDVVGWQADIPDFRIFTLKASIWDFVSNEVRRFRLRLGGLFERNGTPRVGVRHVVKEQTPAPP